MRGKILLSIKLPATQKSYEFRAPLDLTVEQTARLASTILSQREPARYSASDEVDLMLCGNGAGAGGQLNPNETLRALAEQGVLVNGSPLALV